MPVNSNHLSMLLGQTHPNVGQYFDHTNHIAPPSGQATRDIYNNEILNAPQNIRAAHHAPEAEDGASPKIVVVAPHSGTRFLLKHYGHINSDHPSDLPSRGFAESTSQALYHAAGIGDLHQSSHVALHDVNGRQEPMVVIPMSPDHKQVYKATWDEMNDLTHNEQTGKDARKISIMDFLGENGDRHAGNYMFNQKGRLLAIDNAEGLDYHNGHGYDHFQRYMTKLSGGENTDWKDDLGWWTTQKGNIVRAMDRELNGVKNPKLRSHIAANFKARTRFLDGLAETGFVGGSYGNISRNVDFFGTNIWREYDKYMYEGSNYDKHIYDEEE